MFEGAESFNQPIGSWQVERVELIERMFAGAVSFNHDLGQWHLDSLKKSKEMEQFLSGADKLGECPDKNIVDFLELGF